MASFWNSINPFSKKSAIGSFLFGSPEKHERIPTLLPEQMDLLRQLLGAAKGKGAGGAYGDVADYYRDILGNDSNTLDQLFAPEMRNFNQQVIPQLAEQFAGMGSGNLNSSGFRNASMQAGTDLSERLAAMRANLRSQAASGLSGLGGMGLQNYSQDVMTQPGTRGALSGLGEAAGSVLTGALGNYFSNPALGAASSFLSSSRPTIAKRSSPYGNDRGMRNTMGSYPQSPYGMY